MISDIFELFKNNEVFSGVALGSMLTSIIVGLGYSLKKLPNQIFYVIKRFITVKLEIHSDQPEYKSVSIWAKQFNSQNLRTYLLNSKSSILIGFNEENSIPFLTPGIGRHIVFYNKQPVIIEKSIELKNTRGVIETIIITTIGNKPTLIKKILNEITDITLMNHKLKVYNVLDNEYWELTYKNKRSINGLVFNRKYEIIESIRTFYNNQDWYLSKGISFKKGMLLSGPPGTGKSTLVSVIASELDLNIFYLNLSDKLTSKNLIKYISKVKEQSIILIEDIDCLFMAQDRELNGNNENLSTLLNVLDGINSIDGVIYILTTNYVDRIDKALIRPGRIDLYIQMENFKYSQIKEMYNIFYNDISNFDIFYSEFKKLLNNGEIAPSSLQNLFIHFSTPQQLINGLKEDMNRIQIEYLRNGG